MISKIFAFFLDQNYKEVIRDWRFWVLLFAINNCGNLGFNHYISEPVALIILTIIIIPFVRKFLYNEKYFIIGFAIVYLLQIAIVSNYQLTTTFHHYQQLFVAIMLIKCIGEKFKQYYNSIILIYAVISLICFSMQYVGLPISFIARTDSLIDGGEIMRVYNLYYTQLGAGKGLSVDLLRNCGPFWEPGAFQGFLNLALFYEITTIKEYTLSKYLRIGIFVFTIITTFSTGGYVALFLNICFFLYHNKRVHFVARFALLLGFLFIAYHYYTTLAFMGEKIAGDSGRLNFSLDSFGDIGTLLFGYGYDITVFTQTSMQSAGALIQQFNYTGVVGGIILLLGLFFNNYQDYRYFYFILLCILLMNEPYLVNSFIFWGLPFVYYSYEKQHIYIKPNFA